MIRDGRRVLVFSAHAADFCSRAGGAIIRLTESGGNVLIYNMTFGERCESPALWARDVPPSIPEIKDIRGKEMTAAADLLGAEIRCFDFGDCPLVIGPERRPKIVEAIRAFKPDLVLTHWIRDELHPDHVEATKAVLWASRYCDAPGLLPEQPICDEPDVFCYEVTLGTAPFTGFIPDVYVDISETFERKIEALNQFRSQPQLSANYEVLARYRALEAKTTANIKSCVFAEAFCRITGQ